MEGYYRILDKGNGVLGPVMDHVPDGQLNDVCDIRQMALYGFHAVHRSHLKNSYFWDGV